MRILYDKSADGGGGSNLGDTVQLNVTSTAKLPGLDAALTKLNALDTALKTVQNRLAGLSTGSAFKLSAAQYAAKIPSKGAQDVRKMAKLWGFPDVKDVQNVAREIEGELQRSLARVQSKLDKAGVSATRGSTKARDALRAQLRTLSAQSLFTNPTAEVLKNPTRAGQFAEAYAKRALVNRVDAEGTMRALLGGAAPAGGALFPVQPPASPKKGTSPRPSPHSSDERGEGGAKPAKVANPANAKFQDALEKVKLELAQNLNTADLAKVASARAKAAAQVQGLVGGDRDGKVSQRTKDRALRYAADQQRQATQVGQDLLSTTGENLGNIRKKLAAAEKLNQREKARQLKTELDAEESRLAGLKKLNQVFYKPQAKANQQRQQSAAKAAALVQEQASAEAARMAQHTAVQKHWEMFMQQPGAQETARSGQMALGKDGKWTRTLEGQRTLPGGKKEFARAEIGHDATFKHGPMEPPSKHNKWSSAVGGLNVRDMAANVIKVGTWAAAVGVLYKSVELAEYSLHRLEHTGMEMAHLGIVFRGNGGSARELTNDIIALAASEGRSTEEAMKSATEWARLGGDRATVNEQVRVSALAANIADMSMVETTKKLSDLTHIYHLEAGDLNGLLGQLVNTSVKYNIELGEMFNGLDRSAAAARVAGMGLSELQAMIGVVVGGGGGTGSMSGNSIKYILQELNKPDIQKQLRGYGIEPLTNTLEQKPAGQILADLSGKFGTLGKRSQGAMSNLLGGRFNASRVPIVLENYPKILQLAIDGQLHLNKAQEYNVKILQTLRAQLTGIKTEYDRMLLSSHAMLGLTTGATFVKNMFSDIANHAAKIGLTDEDIVKNKRSSMKANPLTMDAKHGYFNTLGSNLLATGATMSRIALGQTIMGMLPGEWAEDKYRTLKQVPGLVDYSNFQHEPPAPQGQEGHEARMVELQKAGTVNELAVRQFGLGGQMNSSGSLSAGNANSMADVMLALGHKDNAKKFSTAYQMGDTAGAGEILEQEKGTALMAQKTALDGRAEELKKRETDLKDEGRALATKHREANQGKGTYTEDDVAHEQAVGAALQKVQQDTKDLTAAYASNAGELDNVQIVSQKYISLLKTQGDEMSRIGQLGGLIKFGDAIMEQAQKVETASAQLAELRSQQKSFDNTIYPLGTDQTAEAHQVNRRMLEEIRQKQAEVDSLNSPGQGRLSRFENRMNYGIRAIDRESSSQKYGYNETEKLLREQSYLQDKINSLGQITNRTAEQEGQYREATNRAFENSLSLRQRQCDIEREINQLAIDQRKEFQKAFMGAGPDEMLRKLAAFRINSANPGGLSQGAFFGLGSATRGDLGQLNSAYNPEMMWLKRERRQNDKAVAGLPGFAAGGYTGDGPANEVAGVVHRGEVVIPKKDVDAWASGPPTTAAGWAAYDKQNRDTAWEALNLKNGGNNPTTQAGWDARDKASRDARWKESGMQTQWENDHPGEKFPTSHAGWAAADKAARDTAWEALNQKNGGNNPTTQAGWDARDKSSRDARWKESGMQTQWENDHPGENFPTSHAGWAAADKAARNEAWKKEFGGPDWRDKQRHRDELSASRMDAWRQQRGQQRRRQPGDAWDNPRRAGDAWDNPLPPGAAPGIPSATNPSAPAGGSRTQPPAAPAGASRGGSAGGAGGGGNGSTDPVSSVLVEIANRISAAGSGVASALDGVAAKLNQFMTGANFAMPQNPQSGGNGGGRGFAR